MFNWKGYLIGEGIDWRGD